MTYRLTKDGWVGYCDECKTPCIPGVVQRNRWLRDNQKLEWRTETTWRKECLGWCVECCEKRKISPNDSNKTHVEIIQDVKVV